MAIHIPDAIAAFTAGPDWIRFDSTTEIAFCRDAGPIFITVTAQADGFFGARVLHLSSGQSAERDPVDLSGLPALLADVQALITKATTTTGA